MFPNTRLAVLWARVLDPAALLLAVTLGALSVGGVTQGPVQLALRMLAGLAVLYLFVRLSLGYFISRTIDLEAELEESRAERAEITDAVLRVVDRQTPQYTETVNLTVVVGKNDESDLIEEEIVTIPLPPLLYRAVRPVVPDHDMRSASLEDLRFNCEVDEGDDGPVGVTVLQLGERRPLRAWIVFEPALKKKATWRISYRPRGLWSPFRERGRDHLAWSNKMPYNADGLSSLTDFSVKFVFAEASWSPSVEERNGLGRVVSRGQNEDGEWEIVWHDPNPAGYRYEWDLVRRLNGAPVNASSRLDKTPSRNSMGQLLSSGTSPIPAHVPSTFMVGGEGGRGK